MPWPRFVGPTRPAPAATAPEQAVDQIVTEAEETASLAPTRSVRPPSVRPSRPTPVAVAEPAPEPKPDASTANAVNAALAEALAGPAENTDAPVGPPLSAGEKDALRVAVSQCWNVGSQSSEALQTTVVVGVSMNKNGTPISGSIQMLGSSGGSSAAARQAF